MLSISLQLTGSLRIAFSNPEDVNADGNTHDTGNDQGPGVAPYLCRPDYLIIQETSTQTLQYIGSRGDTRQRLHPGRQNLYGIIDAGYQQKYRTHNVGHLRASLRIQKRQHCCCNTKTDKRDASHQQHENGCRVVSMAQIEREEGSHNEQLYESEEQAMRYSIPTTAYQVGKARDRSHKCMLNRPFPALEGNDISHTFKGDAEIGP